MRRFRPRLTIRSFVIAVAISALAAEAYRLRARSAAFAQKAEMYRFREGLHRGNILMWENQRGQFGVVARGN